MSTTTLVDQTILAGDAERPGNCVAACVATFLGINLIQVPHFIEYGVKTNGDDDRTHWWILLTGFMAGHGYWPTELEDLNQAEPGEIVFVMGPSPRGVHHQVLYRDGLLFHDPHPSRAGVHEVLEVIAFRGATHDHTPTGDHR